MERARGELAAAWGAVVVPEGVCWTCLNGDWGVPEPEAGVREFTRGASEGDRSELMSMIAQRRLFNAIASLCVGLTLQVFWSRLFQTGVSFPVLSRP